MVPTFTFKASSIMFKFKNSYGVLILHLKLYNSLRSFKYEKTSSNFVRSFPVSAFLAYFDKKLKLC